MGGAPGPHGPLVFGLEGEGGGGAIEEITSVDGTVVVTNPTGPITDLSVPAQNCVALAPILFGAGRIAPAADMRYLQPAGEYTGTNVADNNPIPVCIQAAGRTLRFQMRIRTGNGNGDDIEYEAMELVAGVAVSFPNPMIITLPSTFSGTAEILATNALVDGTELLVQVRKNTNIGTSPDDLQGCVQVENDCGGGGGGGTSCCAPSYLSQNQFNAYAEIYITGTGFAVDLDASACGQPPGDPGVLTAVIRPSFFAGPPGTPPVVVSAEVDNVNNIARITIDSTAATDGRYVLEVTNDCGCCFLIPLEGVSV